MPTADVTVPPLRAARACYDHAAGVLGVTLLERLLAMRWLSRGGGDEYEVTRRGEEAFARLGVDVASARSARRRFAYGCLDCTERRPHLAGALGAMLLASAVLRGWIERDRDSRALRVTPSGRRALRSRFGIETFRFSPPAPRTARTPPR